MRAGLVAASFALLMLAGCLDADPKAPSPDGLAEDVDGVLSLSTIVPSVFRESIVTPAVGWTNDLYEPTMEVSQAGTIFVTGHTIGVDTTGAPVFGSWDDGQTWEQLPWPESFVMPEPMHGATPPVSDEIFLMAGDDGYLYGVDITAFAYPVNAWSDEGRRHVYYNANAYDRVEATTTPIDEADDCNALVSLNDRPWGAYDEGHLLMVNNPGGGPMQIGMMPMPIEQLVDVPGNPATGPIWNLCASSGGGIPGVPDMRDDHFFAVPQTAGGKLHVVVGSTDDIMEVEQRHVFDYSTIGGGTSNGGRVAFDADGTMYIAIRNNTAREEADGSRVFDTGQLRLAVSTDDGQTFHERAFVVGDQTTSVYLDGNNNGPGSLLAWSQRHDDGTDWFVGHFHVGDDGLPDVRNVMLVLKDGPPTSAHVQGAALGPDGRAYIVTFHGGYGATTWSPSNPPLTATPLHVWVQDEGPMMPA